VREKIKENRPYFFYRGPITLQPDNARPHDFSIPKFFFVGMEWTTITHPLYLLDLPLSDYHLFRSIKNHLDGKTCDNNQEVKMVLLEFFDSKPSFFLKIEFSSFKIDEERYFLSKKNIICKKSHLFCCYCNLNSIEKNDAST
jgi:hypothetical protein